VRTFGDHLTLHAAACIYNVKFVVIDAHSSDKCSIVSPDLKGGYREYSSMTFQSDTDKLLLLGYFPKPTEHYVSLATTSSECLEKLLKTVLTPSCTNCKTLLNNEPQAELEKTDIAELQDGDHEQRCRDKNSTGKKRKLKRKYDESYIRFGFIAIGDTEAQNPQCVMCGDVLSNESMKPSKLMRHLRTRHADVEGKPKQFFELKASKLHACKNSIKSLAQTNVAALRASFKVALRIAKAKKPYIHCR
jgi:hypothetical protein